MLTTMSQTTRNAPFGTDDTPAMQVKIVGGKRVQITVDKSKQTDAENPHFNQTWPLPKAGPHGTPSILTQPNWEAYDSRVQSRYNTSDQHNLARNVSSFTSPNGDRSYSFKHGGPVLNTKAILPPIATQSADPVTYRRTSSLNSNHAETPATLEEQVARQLKGFTVQKLKDMYIDLTTYDRQLTGMLGEAQFSVVALRHDLPLKLSLLKIIFAKFIDFRDPSMINYEKVLQFFSDCLSGGNVKTSPIFFSSGNEERRTKTSSPRRISPVKSEVGHREHLKNGLEKYSSLSNANGVKSPIHSEPGVPQVNSTSSPLRKEVEDKLLELILAQIASNEILEIDDLRNSLRELDRAERGTLPIHVINSACVRHRLPLTSSLITKLLQRAETNSGMADWKLFLGPLDRVSQIRVGSKEVATSPMKNADSLAPSRRSLDPTPFLKSPPAQAMNTPLPMPQWERKPLGKIGNGAASVPAYSRDTSFAVSKPSFASAPASPPSTTSSLEREIAQLPEGWDERETIPQEEPYDYVSPRRNEPWSHKFNKLAHALHTYHPFNKEILARDEAERITKNYNLIYGLGFSEKKIEHAVKQSVLPKKENSSSEEIAVEALLEILEGKRRLII